MKGWGGSTFSLQSLVCHPAHGAAHGHQNVAAGKRRHPDVRGARGRETAAWPARMGPTGDQFSRSPDPPQARAATLSPGCRARCLPRPPRGAQGSANPCPALTSQLRQEPLHSLEKPEPNGPPRARHGASRLRRGPRGGRSYGSATPAPAPRLSPSAVGRQLLPTAAGVPARKAPPPFRMNHSRAPLPPRPGTSSGPRQKAAASRGGGRALPAGGLHGDGGSAKNKIKQNKQKKTQAERPLGGVSHVAGRGRERIVWVGVARGLPRSQGLAWGWTWVRTARALALVSLVSGPSLTRTWRSKASSWSQTTVPVTWVWALPRERGVSPR